MTASLPPWVLICGGFHRLGGMDRANCALADALLAQGREVHLVGHQVDPQLLANANVKATVVPRPLGVLMAEGALRRAGMRVAAEVTRRNPDARVVVNGGNCPWPDINWVHFVHGTWPRFDQQAPLWFRAKSRMDLQKARRDERSALQRAKLVIANSELTRRDLATVGVAPDKVHTIYLGSEPDWIPPTPEERDRARQSFNLPVDARIVGFAGGLGYDRRKGFDTLLTAWREANLADALLVAAGGGRGIVHWQKQIDSLGLNHRVRLLGFTNRAGDLYSACDLFVSPVRYEAFGLNVLEALCRGVPSIVTRSAGVAELYPPELSRWLLGSPEDSGGLAALLSDWYAHLDACRSAFQSFSTALRSYTMLDMANKIIAVAEHL